MSLRVRNLLIAFLVGLVVVSSFVIEGWWGRTYYAQDAISYLDVSKAIVHSDWNAALNPYWSLGYPFILAVTRWMFPDGPLGEWTAIHVVNLVLLVLTYVSFLYFLQTAIRFTAKANDPRKPYQPGAPNGFLFFIGTSIFLLWQLQSGNAARVSPDPLVSCLFFLVVAEALKFCLRPSAETAALLGFLLGIGYIIKAVYVAIGAGVILVLAIHAMTRSRVERLRAILDVGIIILVMALVALPYVIALSVTVGKFTLGESSGLNYAWNVNKMPRSCDWQGSDGIFGKPIHPTQLMQLDPPVFTFVTPFQVTYAPWFNPPYWYEGYEQSFDLMKQLSAFADNFRMLRRCFFDSSGLEGSGQWVKMGVFVIVLALAIYLLKERKRWFRRFGAIWPLYVLPIVAICVYLPVFIEIRYIVGFVIVLLVVPFLPLFMPRPVLSRSERYVVATFIGVVCAIIAIAGTSETLKRAIHLEPFTHDIVWQLGLSLPQYGIEPGDKVAYAKAGNGNDCTWAFVGGVRIVGELGNDAYDYDGQDEDLSHFTEIVSVQDTVLDQFRIAGAKAVILYNEKSKPNGPGWQQFQRSGFWLRAL